MLVNRTIVCRAIQKMVNYLELGAIKEAEQFWNLAILADLTYMRNLEETNKCVADIIVNTAEEIEKKGNHILAEVLLAYAEQTDEKYEEPAKEEVTDEQEA